MVVLAVLSEETLSGYAITKRVAARSAEEIKLSPGVLYPLLAKMERQGLITSSWETVRSEPARSATDSNDADGDAESGGRRRK